MGKNYGAIENHKVTIENREITTITDIIEIDSFDEKEIRAKLSKGTIIIKGEKLNIQKLDLETGITEIGGIITSLMYVKVKEKNEKCILTRMLK